MITRRSFLARTAGAIAVAVAGIPSLSKAARAGVARYADKCGFIVSQIGPADDSEAFWCDVDDCDCPACASLRELNNHDRPVPKYKWKIRGSEFPGLSHLERLDA